MSTEKRPDTITKSTLRALDLQTHTDAYGVEYGLLVGHGRATVLVSVRAREGSAATTRFTARLGEWSEWLGSLGLDDRVCGASLSVQTWESAASSTLLGLSFTTAPRPGEKEKALGHRELVEEISTHLGRVLDGLRTRAPGLSVRQCTAQDVIDVVRTLFDSSVAADIEAAREGEGTMLSWTDAPPGPEQTVEGAYAHDRVVSTSWAMATREDEALPPLDFDAALVPTPGILCKRTTLIFRPALSLEATLAPFGLVVTADVSGADQLPLALQLPERQALRTRLRLRAATYTQDTTFLAGLPLDLATPHTVMVPDALKGSFR